MKATKFIYFISIGLIMFALGCEPEYTEVGTVAKPDATKVDFTITTVDDFTVTVTSTSSIDGIFQWDLGNGKKATDTEVTTKYQMPATYNITLTVFTKGGSASVTKQFVQTKTDWTIFNDPLFIALSGGLEDADGKTWMLDKETKGHLGVGAGDNDEPGWWSADPMAKDGHQIYDDEYTFILQGLQYKIDTHGYTHAGHAGATYGRQLGIYGTVAENLFSDDYDEDVKTNDVARGAMTWMVTKDGSTYYIEVSPNQAVFGYDMGGERKYKVLEWNTNFISVNYKDADGAHRYGKFIPKGYTRPSVTFDLKADKSANPNEAVIGIMSVNIPPAASISNIEYNFGDGSAKATTTNKDETFTHIYMKKGTYTVTAVVTSSLGTITKTASLTFADNHPTYVPPAEYIEEGMALYTDFDQVFSKMSIDKAGGEASFRLVTNPSKTGENTSNLCLEFNKTSNQWANMYIPLSNGFRFDFTVQTKFKLKVYGTKGTRVLLKVENMDLGGNAWQTGAELTYTIEKDNTWEIAEYDFTGVGNNGSADPKTSDITTDATTKQGYYNVVRVMVNSGDGDGTHQVLLDNWSGINVTGWKK